MREGQSGLVTALASSGVWVRKEVVMSRPREPASTWGGGQGAEQTAVWLRGSTHVCVIPYVTVPQPWSLRSASSVHLRLHVAVSTGVTVPVIRVAGHVAAHKGVVVTLAPVGL